MYYLGDYAAMMSDPARMRGLTRALEHAVAPGDVVVDLGAGAGIFTLLACRLGAKRVHAIETTDAINVARTVVEANGYADRVEFHQTMSTEVTLPAPADVVFADLTGMLPWHELSIPSIIDARNRFLKPGGILTPARDAAWAALVAADDLYDLHTQPWNRLSFGFDLESMHHLLTNTWARRRLGKADLLTDPVRFTTVDYMTVEDPNVRARVSWIVERGGTAHFIAVGMDRMPGSPEWYSNDPTAPADRQFSLVGVPMLLPLTQPVPLMPGHSIAVDISGTLVGTDYVWTWNTSVHDATGSGVATFGQSTFLSAPISLAELRTSAPDSIPAATERIRIASLVLAHIEQGHTLGEIAARVQDAYPSRFPRFDAALTYVAALVHELS